MNTGEKPVSSTHGLVTTTAWGIGDKITYALEDPFLSAEPQSSGCADEIKVIESLGGFREYMAQKVNDTNGCYVVPAFTGLGAPCWDQYARENHSRPDPRRQQIPCDPRNAESRSHIRWMMS